MAKPTKPTEAPKFEFDLNLPVPAIVRQGNGATSDLRDKLLAMPVGASFLEPISVPENITDEAERAKAFTEGARRLSNRLSGAARRVRNAHPDREFVTRIVKDDTLGHGVRIWRQSAPASEPKADQTEA